jgi:hypothetical protein
MAHISNVAQQSAAGSPNPIPLKTARLINPLLQQGGLKIPKHPFPHRFNGFALYCSKSCEREPLAFGSGHHLCFAQNLLHCHTTSPERVLISFLHSFDLLWAFLCSFKLLFLQQIVNLPWRGAIAIEKPLLCEGASKADSFS